MTTVRLPPPRLPGGMSGAAQSVAEATGGAAARLKGLLARTRAGGPYPVRNLRRGARPRARLLRRQNQPAHQPVAHHALSGAAIGAAARATKSRRAQRSRHDDATLQ